MPKPSRATRADDVSPAVSRDLGVPFGGKLQAA